MVIEATTTRVVQAGYYEEGYVALRWESPDAQHATAFVLTVDGIGPGQVTKKNVFVEDGMARFCTFPCELDSRAQYTLTVTPISPDNGELPASAPYPLPLRPLPSAARLEFVERLAYTPLFVKSGDNVVKVRLLTTAGKPMAGKTIRWGVPPEYRSLVRFYPSATATTDYNGIARNRILVGAGNLTNVEMPEALTVSAWLDEAGAATEPDSDLSHHIATVFDCVEPRVFCSFVRNYAHPLPQRDPAANSQNPADDQLIEATATILDDKSRPVRGLMFSWRMAPNAATLAYSLDRDGSRSKLTWTQSPPYEAGFRACTDDRGQSTILFANAAPQIMDVSMAVNAIEYPYKVVFTAVDEGRGDLPSLKLPFSGKLNLNEYRDSVPVALPPLADVEIFEAVIWVNHDVVPVKQSVLWDSRPRPIDIPSWRFASGDALNSMGYVAGQLTGNAQDSTLVQFGAFGTAKVPTPQQNGTLDAPFFDIGRVTIVNDAVVAGGLRIRIPAYAGIAAGQNVTLSIFINAYYQNSVYPKFGFLTLSHEVARHDADDGFMLVIDQNDLTGFATVQGIGQGTFVAQYSVVAQGQATSVFSKLLSAGIDTSVPYQDRSWVAMVAAHDQDVSGLER